MYLELLVSLQDQPERRSANSIMLGGSTYTARWGYSLNVAAVSSKIPSCQSCFRDLLLGHSTSSNACTECTNWVTDDNNVLLRYSPPNNYPEMELHSNGKLAPLHLKYDLLKRAVSLTATNIENGTWDKGVARAYLHVHGLNKKAIDGILRGGWEFPALWTRGVELSQHIDVPLHLFFLGVVRTCIHMVHDWMTKRHKSASFIRYTKNTLESIQKLGLSWCKCIAYKSGTLGGWVSENYLALARLLPWFYGSIDTIAEDQQFETPTVAQKHWTKQQNVAWLSVRGLNTRGTAKELQIHVHNYLAAQEGPPPVLPLQGGPVVGVQEMLFSLHHLICHVMHRSSELSHIFRVERAIKNFLTYFEHFDKAMRRESDTPTWITSYNFICLLNVPNMLATFGPLRNFWEGGGMGEKFIQQIKPLWNGFRKNWQLNLLDNVLQKMAINRIEKHSQQNVNKGKQFHKYKDKEDVTDNFNNRKPMSMIQLDNGKFFFSVMKNNTFVPVMCTTYFRTICGWHYHYWHIADNDDHEVNIFTIQRCCLLLPLMSSTGLPTSNDDAIYTVIDYDWKDIQANTSFSAPNIEDIL